MGRMKSINYESALLLSPLRRAQIRLLYRQLFCLYYSLISPTKRRIMLKAQLRVP